MNQRERIQRRNQIEYELQYRLDNVLEKIKNDGLRDTGLAQRRYGNEVNRNFRASIEDAYQLGIDYVTAKKNTVGFLTSVDIDTIRKQVDDYVIKFWRKVDQLIHRNDVLLQKYNYAPRSPLNSNYMATVIAVGAITTTLALATKQKAMVLQSHFRSAAVRRKKKKPIPKKKAPVTPLTDEQIVSTDEEVPDSTLNDLLTTLPLALTSGMFLTPDEYGNLSIQDTEPVSRFVLVWNATLDNRTCPTCEELDQTEWSPDAPNLPTPGDDGDIHANCRCMWDVQEVFG